MMSNMDSVAALGEFNEVETTLSLSEARIVLNRTTEIRNKSGQPIETNIAGEISLNNCSMAAFLQPMSC